MKGLMKQIRKNITNVCLCNKRNPNKTIQENSENILHCVLKAYWSRSNSAISFDLENDIHLLHLFLHFCAIFANSCFTNALKNLKQSTLLWKTKLSLWFAMDALSLTSLYGESNDVTYSNDVTSATAGPVRSVGCAVRPHIFRRDDLAMKLFLRPFYPYCWFK